MMDISAVVVGVVIVVTLCGLVGLVWLINTLATIQDFIRKTAGVPEPAQNVQVLPTPLETKKHDAPLTVGVFNAWREERAKDLARLEEAVSALDASFVASTQYQARARQGIHRRINSMDSSLSFIAGRFEQEGDHAGAEAIMRKLHDGRGGNNDGE